ncbi:MAG TPA: hypothetical protein DEP23_04635 [Ruminococcaceae bacterium]|nr:hypothetical protein [Oscillospiraceae bacterium]
MDKNIVKACAGIVGAKISVEPYASAVAQAESKIGVDFAPEAEKARKDLVQAVKKNLANRKENPYSALKEKYNLPVGKNYFTKEKKKFCYALAKSLKMI